MLIVMFFDPKVSRAFAKKYLLASPPEQKIKAKNSNVHGKNERTRGPKDIPFSP